MTRAEQLAWVGEASRAPSAHNVQPARWRFVENGLELWADETRRLPVGDPTGHDHRVGLGAAWEGMAIALTRDGLALGEPELAPASSAGTPARVLVARGAWRHGASEDALAPFVHRRATWRGRFAEASAADSERLRTHLVHFDGVPLVRDPEVLAWLWKELDRANLEFMSDPRYFAELFRWMRLSARDPNWSRDGLNAEALALTGFDRFVARLVGRPAVHALLKRLGLLGMLAEESPRAKTASAALLLLAPLAEDPFVTGRRMYRIWLSVTAAGWALCPMSALTDSKRTNEAIRERCALPADRRLVNVLRLGPAPESVRLAPRLPATELVLEELA